MPPAASTVRSSPALVSVSVAVVPASTSISSPATELPTVALCPAWTPNIVAALLSVRVARSEEHTSEPQSLMCISYAVFCLKQHNNKNASIQQLLTIAEVDNT